MKYALNLAEDGRILSVTYEEYAAEGMPIVDEMPEGDAYDYKYIDGVYIYDPLPEPVQYVTAPRNLTAGEYITIKGVMYKATSNIPNGEEIIVGQNAIATTIEEQLAELAKGE